MNFALPLHKSTNNPYIYCTVAFPLPSLEGQTDYQVLANYTSSTKPATDPSVKAI